MACSYHLYPGNIQMWPRRSCPHLGKARFKEDAFRAGRCSRMMCKWDFATYPAFFALHTERQAEVDKQLHEDAERTAAKQPQPDPSRIAKVLEQVAE